MPKRRRSPEADLQRAVCEYLDRALPFGWRYWHNYQNAPTVQAQARMKALGVKAGIPDLILAGPDRQMIAIELKSPKGRTSVEQEDWLDWFTCCGWHAAVARSVDDVEDSLRFAGLKPRASVRQSDG